MICVVSNILKKVKPISFCITYLTFKGMLVKALCVVIEIIPRECRKTQRSEYDVICDSKMPLISDT